MSSVQAHYDEHLGPVYAWMFGGAEPAIERGAAELQRLGIPHSDGGLAVDLGAGFGAHAIPLARRGFEVLAIDSCAALLDDLRARQDDLPIETVLGDLRYFRRHVSRQPELVLCMGDTLTHLEDEASVIALIETASSALGVDGCFIVTFRDYSNDLVAEQRFIHVRSDDRRILTCFLEYTTSRVTVHDILHERSGDVWQLRVSAYPKLRISPEWLVKLMEEHGFGVEHSVGASGMACLVARPRIQ